MLNNMLSVKRGQGVDVINGPYFIVCTSGYVIENNKKKETRMSNYTSC